MEVVEHLAGMATLRPQQALILYKGHGEVVIGRTHPVQKGEAGLILGAGRQVSHEEVEAFARSLSETPRTREILPACALYSDASLLAWHVPARRRVIYFDGRALPALKRLSGSEVWHPPLLFVAQRKGLRVYALNSEERPEADTPLFVAPYPNLYDNGSMCSGNVRLPSALRWSEREGWERAFYDSAFTHSNAKTLTTHPQGLAGVWRRAKTIKSWHAQWLVEAKKTLHEAVNG
jgi:PRTRC genetic system protein B